MQIHKVFFTDARGLSFYSKSKRLEFYNLNQYFDVKTNNMARPFDFSEVVKKEAFFRQWNLCAHVEEASSTFLIMHIT